LTLFSDRAESRFPGEPFSNKFRYDSASQVESNGIRKYDAV